MTTRKAPPSLFYSVAPAVEWVRTLSEFIDESLGALCARQWQRAPVMNTQAVASALPRRRTR